MRKVYLQQISVSVVGIIAFAAIALALIKVFVISAPPVTAGEDVQSGAGLFTSKGCIYCHHTDSEDSKAGPGLKSLFDLDQLPVSGRAVTEENVRRQIMAPYRNMPSYENRLTDDQLDELVDYLKTL